MSINIIRGMQHEGCYMEQISFINGQQLCEKEMHNKSYLQYKTPLRKPKKFRRKVNENINHSKLS